MAGADPMGGPRRWDAESTPSGANVRGGSRGRAGHDATAEGGVMARRATADASGAAAARREPSSGLAARKGSWGRQQGEGQLPPGEIPSRLPSPHESGTGASAQQAASRAPARRQESATQSHAPGWTARQTSSSRRNADRTARPMQGSMWYREGWSQQNMICLSGCCLSAPLGDAPSASGPRAKPVSAGSDGSRRANRPASRYLHLPESSSPRDSIPGMMPADSIRRKESPAPCAPFRSRGTR